MNSMPSDIIINGKELSVTEHYEILEMEPRDIQRKYGLCLVELDAFITKVKYVVEWWENYDLLKETAYAVD